MFFVPGSCLIPFELFIFLTRLSNMAAAALALRAIFSRTYRSPSLATMSTVTGFFWPNRQHRRTATGLAWTRDRLDLVQSDLEVRAEQLAATGAALQYAVTVIGDGQVLEGIASGDPKPLSPDFFDNLRAEIMQSADE